jgi:hypothetical protein
MKVGICYKIMHEGYLLEPFHLKQADRSMLKITLTL